ncbi:MAG: phosphatidate cytidylyltransferase, partial [Syntrophomonadaceae bacterium]|nr:phosphatidate cytidylyltransferase [Syntrophomonadaceae bacterium]
MLGMRILTAAIGIPVLLLLVRAGGWLLAASFSLLGFIGWWEFCRLARAGGLKPWFWLGALGVLSWPLAAYLYSRGCPGPLLGLNVWMLIATAMGFIIYHPQRDLGDAAATLWGQLYLGGLLSHAVLMREASQGLFWVLLALVVVTVAVLGVPAGFWREPGPASFRQELLVSLGLATPEPEA